MDTAQQSASKVVCRVLGGRNLDQALEEERRALPARTAQQGAALQDLSFGAVRHYGLLDRVLRQLLHKPLSDERIRCLMLVALYQLQFGKSAHHAVVDHAVRAARSMNAATSGLVNAVLRNFLRRRDALISNAKSTDEGRYSCPQWWVDEMRRQHGESAEQVLLTGIQLPPMTLRVNRRRMEPSEYLLMLQREGIAAVGLGHEALRLARPQPVDKLPGFFDGLVSVQDAGAQHAARLLDVHDGMRVLDACSAPGGKAAHILEGARVELLALDRDELRLARVSENLDRLGLAAEVRCGDAAEPAVWWDGKPFQRILADVPCSASGVVRRHPDIKWLRRPEDIEGYAQQQEKILRALWPLLDRGGKLLYATCSVFERENRQVVDAFLAAQGDARRVPVSVAEVGEGQLLPDDQHDGFYYALLQKTA